MSASLFAVQAGRGAVRGCFPTLGEAEQQKPIGTRRNRVVACGFQPMRSARRFLPVEIDWDLTLGTPGSLLDVPQTFEMAGDHIGDSLVRVTRAVALGHARDMNRQSLAMVRPGVTEVSWTVVVELGRVIGGCNTFELTIDSTGVCESTWQRLFRVVRVVG